MCMLAGNVSTMSMPSAHVRSIQLAFAFKYSNTAECSKQRCGVTLSLHSHILVTAKVSSAVLKCWLP